MLHWVYKKIFLFQTHFFAVVCFICLIMPMHQSYGFPIIKHLALPFLGDLLCSSLRQDCFQLHGANPSVIVPIDDFNVEGYADLLVLDHVRELSKKNHTNLLFLSDGASAHQARRLANVIPYSNITSTDIIIKPHLKKLLPKNIHLVENDNVQPFVDFGVKFQSITLLRGLCNHFIWQSSTGEYFDNIGCAGIPLTKSGIANLMFQVSLYLDVGGIFILGGSHYSYEANSRKNKYGLSSPLGEDVLRNVDLAVRYFNSVQNSVLAEVRMNRGGFLIVGSLPRATSFTASELRIFKSSIHRYFVTEKRRFQRITDDSPPDLGDIQSLP